MATIMQWLKKRSSRHGDDLYARQKALNLLQCCQDLDRRAARLSSRPLEIQLEITTRCNLSCTMCLASFDLRRKEAGGIGHMSLDNLRKIEGLLPSVAGCVLFGGGEPLLHPGFLDFVRIISGYAVVLEFHTNGTLLDEKVRHGLVSYGVQTVTISVDGATKATYESIRRGAHFESVMLNIRALAELKCERHQSIPGLEVAVVAMKQNIHEFPAMVSLAAHLGIQTVHLQMLLWHPSPEYKRFYTKQSLAPINKAQLTALLKRAQSIGQAHDMNVYVPPALTKADDTHAQPDTMEHSDALICTQPWTTIFIQWDGAVRPCCYSDALMGNLSINSLEEIWNNMAYVAYRAALLRGEPPRECLPCIKSDMPQHTIAAIRQLLVANCNESTC